MKTLFRRVLLALLLSLLLGLAIGTALRMRLERPVVYLGARFEQGAGAATTSGVRRLDGWPRSTARIDVT